MQVIRWEIECLCWSLAERHLNKPQASTCLCPSHLQFCLHKQFYLEQWTRNLLLHHSSVVVAWSKKHIALIFSEFLSAQTEAPKSECSQSAPVFMLPSAEPAFHFWLIYIPSLFPKV